MKKFIIFAVSLVVTLAIVVGLFFIFREKETLTISPSSVTVNTYEYFSVEVSSNLEKTKTTWDLGTLPNGITYDATTKKFMSTVGGTYVVSYTTSNADFVSLSSTITIADGSESNPFIIDSEEDLKDIGVRTSTLETGDVIRPLNAYYKLAVDLNISASEWTPIGYTLGTANIAEFSGKLDGNGFTITGLNMINNDSGNMKNAGLFYTLSQSGKITNLNLTEVSIIGAYDYAGAFVGINHGTIERSQVSGLIDSTSSNETCTGGITGLNETRVISGLLTSTARIDRVSAVVTVLAGNSDVGLAYAGGLAGKNLGGIIINAYTMNGAGGAIQVRNESSFVGGIVAYNSYIYDDTNPGNISFIDGVVKNTYSTTVVSGGNTLTTKGAIIGFNYNHPDVDLDEEDNLEINRIFGNYYDSTKNSGVIGVSNIADYNDSNTGSIYYNYFSASGKSIEALKQQSTFTACRSYYDEIEMWDFINVWIVDASQNNGFPVLNYTGASIADFPNLIKKANEITTLSGFSDIRKNLSGSYEIIADIDLASVEDWTPIGTKDSPFTGTLLVSNNAKITNLNITTYNKYAGLFGYIGSGAKISGLAIEGVKIVSGEYVGALAGGCAGTIEGCSVKGFDDSYINILYTVESLPQSFNVGGMIGILEGGTVGGEYYESTNTYTYSYVQDLKVMIPMVSNRTVSVGGLIGYVGTTNSLVKYAYTKTQVTFDNTITSVVDTTQYIGGLVGRCEGNIESCYTLAGSVSTNPAFTNSYMGGVVGVLSSGSLKYSFAEVTLTGYYVGGVVGLTNTQFRECYSDNIINAKRGGGIVAYIDGKNKAGFSNCYTISRMYTVDSESGIASLFYYEVKFRETQDQISYAYTAATLNTEKGGSAYYYREPVNIITAHQQKYGSTIFVNTTTTEGISLITSYGFWENNDNMTEISDTEFRQWANFQAEDFSDQIWWPCINGTYPTLKNVVEKFI